MAKLSELVKGFRANVREGIPAVLKYDGERIYLHCSKFTDGYVGLTTRKRIFTPCFNDANCPNCPYFKPNPETDKVLPTGTCEIGCIKPVN